LRAIFFAGVVQGYPFIVLIGARPDGQCPCDVNGWQRETGHSFPVGQCARSATKSRSRPAASRRIKIIAAILARPVIDKILTDLGLLQP